MEIRLLEMTDTLLHRPLAQLTQSIRQLSLKPGEPRRQDGRSKLRRFAGVKYAFLDSILAELTKEGRIRISGEKITLANRDAL